MAISVKTCPHCKHKHTETYSIGLGAPFTHCVSCGGIYIDEDVTEWELKNIFQKLYFFIIHTYTSVLIGVIPIVFFLGLKEFEIADYLGVKNENIFPFWFVAFIISFIYLSIKLQNEIAESKARMRDPKFRETLKFLGLLK